MFRMFSCDNSDREVSISLPSGTYYGEQHVTISCKDPSAQITYSLDGSDPGESNYVYNNDVGININYSSTLKATAGGNVAEATYEIIPFGNNDANQQAYYNMIAGNYATDASQTNKFSINSTNVTFVQPGQEQVTSQYYLKDINGGNATLIYKDASGNNVEVPVVADPANNKITVNNITYTKDWAFM